MSTHLGFIVAAYGVTLVALLGTVLALVADQRTQRQLLARFPDRDPAA